MLFNSCESKETITYKIKKIKTGMPISKVDSIMGKPDNVFIDPANHEQFRYQYNASLGMSDNIYVIFSISDSLVKYINDGQ